MKATQQVAAAFSSVAAVLAICGNAPHSWNSLSSIQKRDVLNRVADRCALPRAAFKLIGDELHFQPSPTARYKAVDCALAQLKHIPGSINFGFIGNEVYDPKVK